ncbi:MAG: DUF262 domain-containing protein [Candidatus Bathyarchaeota archaeon]|nr:DUF262 domain-containing protein [Candidatus Bathyarchaeota archaeon]
MEDKEIVLPNIQRDFIWDEKRIEYLFDSLMRYYPIGIVLLWETYKDLQYRIFEIINKKNKKYEFYNNRDNKKIRLVLDGQQRLQSLYLSFKGTYDNKYLFFNILSGDDSNDFNEIKYQFRFLKEEEASKINKSKITFSNKGETELFYKLIELINISPKNKQLFTDNLIKDYDLPDSFRLIIGQNLDILNDVLYKNDNLLKVTIIDEELPKNSPDCKNDSDVLEAFIRINRQGIELSRSDLIFSFLKLNWSGSATALPEFIEEVNENNNFGIDIDFVIRCLFAVSDLGSKFDIDLLRKHVNVEKIKNNYEQCCNAIKSTIDFVQTECWISSSRLMGGYYNLVPFVYYIYNLKDHQIPNREIGNVRKALYLLAFTSPFSRYADSRLNRFIRYELKSRYEKGDISFPLVDVLGWVKYWEDIENYGPNLLQRNILLTLHLIQHKQTSKILYEKNTPQIDHIFPRSTLREKGFDESEINYFANYWILSKNKNQNKSNKNPKEYFADLNDSILEKAYIERDLLEYSKYKSFIKNREKAILEHIKHELDLTDYDYDYRHHYEK